MLWLLKGTSRRANLITGGGGETKTKNKEKERKQKTMELLQMLLLSSGWLPAKKKPFEWYRA